MATGLNRCGGIFFPEEHVCGKGSAAFSATQSLRKTEVLGTPPIPGSQIKEECNGGTAQEPEAEGDQPTETWPYLEPLSLARPGAEFVGCMESLPVILTETSRNYVWQNFIASA